MASNTSSDSEASWVPTDPNLSSLESVPSTASLNRPTSEGNLEEMDSDVTESPKAMVADLSMMNNDNLDIAVDIPPSVPTDIQAAKSTLPNQGWNLYILFVSLSFMIATVQNGYISTIINSPRMAVQCGDTTEHITAIQPINPGFFKECIAMTDTEWGVMVAIFTIGGMIGGLFGGFLGDIFGRRNFIIFNNIFFILSYALMTFFSNFYVMSLGRLMGGVGSGIASNLVSMYLVEISPTRIRGAIGVLPQLGTTIGILLSSLAGIGLSFRPFGWRILFGLFIVASFLQLALLPFTPESPKWFLIKKKNYGKAERSMNRLRRSTDTAQELKIMEATDTVVAAHTDAKMTRMQRFRGLFRKNLIRIFIAGVGLQIFQQLSGVNVVFAYSTTIFISAGLGNYALICSAIVSAVNVIATVAAVPLVDRAGRKPLLIIGEIICLFFFVLLALCFIFLDRAPQALGIVSVIGVIGFVIGFAPSLGPIPWIIAAEIFPADVKPLYMSVCIAVNWLSNFVVQVTFPPLQNALREYVFLPYVGILVLAIIFTIFFVFETKGRTLDEINAEANKKHTKKTIASESNTGTNVELKAVSSA